MNTQPGYNRILVAVDFSSYTDATIKQALWVARKSGGSLTLVHAMPNLRHLVESASYEGRVDFLYGEGSVFRREVEQESQAKLRKLISDLNAVDVQVDLKTVLGAPYAEISRTVMQDGYDLVMAGSHGLSAWKQFFVGSTSQRLIRNCPTSVWIVKAEHAGPPKVVLSATDFSDVSRRAVLEGLHIAQLAGAEFHLVHVIDSTEFPEELLLKNAWGSSLRDEIKDEAELRLTEFITSLNTNPEIVHRHLTSGAPWREVSQLASDINADLVALGTIGRSGISGVLLGNTAERILSFCACSVLTVKPAEFVSPVLPPFSDPASKPAPSPVQ